MNGIARFGFPRSVSSESLVGFFPHEHVNIFRGLEPRSCCLFCSDSRARLARTSVQADVCACVNGIAGFGFPRSVSSESLVGFFPDEHVNILQGLEPRSCCLFSRDSCARLARTPVQGGACGYINGSPNANASGVRRAVGK